MSITPVGTKSMLHVMITKDGHPIVRSLGVITCLSVPCKDWAVGVDKRALHHHVDNNCDLQWLAQSLAL